MTTSQTTIEAVVIGYMQCALWSSTGDDGESLDGLYETWEISDEGQASMIEDCEGMLDQLEELGVDWTAHWKAEQFGHDFWLTRNGHGAGFWDRYYDGGEREVLGRRLTEMSKAYGTSDLYVGDDGKVHVS